MLRTLRLLFTLVLFAAVAREAAAATFDVDLQGADPTTGHTLRVAGTIDVNLTSDLVTGSDLLMFHNAGVGVSLPSLPTVLNDGIDFTLEPDGLYVEPNPNDDGRLTWFNGSDAVFTINSGPTLPDVFQLRYIVGGASDHVDRVDIGDSQTRVSLATLGVLSGDYNNDGSVDAADYTLWRDNVGQPAGTLPNDTTGGEIGSAQYDLWRANYGVGSGSGAIAVPEPGAIVLALLGTMAITRQRASR